MPRPRVNVRRLHHLRNFPPAEIREYIHQVEEAAGAEADEHQYDARGRLTRVSLGGDLSPRDTIFVHYAP